ncbi:MAG TPA: type II toxin-antitoxin system HicA family toxin [bacterium]|nr:type II toxin-antitoxin system HicA family toxin [bacterium]
MSDKLPLLSGKEVISALKRIGYYIRKQKGSHVRLYHQARVPVTVPQHKELDRRTLKSILQTANLSFKEFMALL